MSRRTHISGQIRIDSFDFFKAVDIKQTIENVLGSTLPRGSEGPIQYTIDKDSTGGLYRGRINLFGDLRDFGKVEDRTNTINRIKNICSQLEASKSILIRSMILSFDDEYIENSFIIKRNIDDEGVPYYTIY